MFEAKKPALHGEQLVDPELLAMVPAEQLWQVEAAVLADILPTAHAGQNVEREISV